MPRDWDCWLGTSTAKSEWKNETAGACLRDSEQAEQSGRRWGISGSELSGFAGDLLVPRSNPPQPFPFPCATDLPSATGNRQSGKRDQQFSMLIVSLQNGFCMSDTVSSVQRAAASYFLLKRSMNCSFLPLPFFAIGHDEVQPFLGPRLHRGLPPRP